MKIEEKERCKCLYFLFRTEYDYLMQTRKGKEYTSTNKRCPKLESSTYKLSTKPLAKLKNFRKFVLTSHSLPHRH
jgi:hypothetical protein